MWKFFEEIWILILELLQKGETIFILFILGIGGILSFSLFRFSFEPSSVMNLILRFFATTWWFWVFFPLFWVFVSLLLFWKQTERQRKLKFVLLEIKIPREIQKSPKSMEQILLNFSSLYDPPMIAKAKYQGGEMVSPYSFEVVSIGGEIHLFIRVLEKLKNNVESAFFSYYPDVELLGVEDYTKRFPQSSEEMYRSGMKVWGIEVKLSKEGFYPIKSYTEFESSSEEKGLDPMSSLLEVLAKVEKNEIVGLQIIATPASPKWAKKYEKDVEELREKIKGSTMAAASPEAGAMSGFTPQPLKYEILKSVENNLSKPAFETVIRLIKIGPEDTFTSEVFIRSGIIGSLNQYAGLNSFSLNWMIAVNTGIWYYPYIFPKIRLEYRRQRLLLNYINREMPPNSKVAKILTSSIFNSSGASESFLLNSEALATIFHLPPATVLTSPHIKRMESKKAGPSAGLPIFGDESDIEKFY